MKHVTDKANTIQIYLRKSLSKISQPRKKDRTDKRKTNRPNTHGKKNSEQTSKHPQIQTGDKISELRDEPDRFASKHAAKNRNRSRKRAKSLREVRHQRRPAKKDGLRKKDGILASDVAPNESWQDAPARLSAKHVHLANAQCVISYVLCQ